MKGEDSYLLLSYKELGLGVTRNLQYRFRKHNQILKSIAVKERDGEHKGTVRDSIFQLKG